jgi:hypothetical protein
MLCLLLNYIAQLLNSIVLIISVVIYLLFYNSIALLRLTYLAYNHVQYFYILVYLLCCGIVIVL